MENNREQMGKLISRYNFECSFYMTSLDTENFPFISKALKSNNAFGGIME